MSGFTLIASSTWLRFVRSILFLIVFTIIHIEEHMMVKRRGWFARFVMTRSWGCTNLYLGNRSFRADSMSSLQRLMLAFATLTFCASVVAACTCAENSARSDFRRAQAIFVGEVVSNQDGASGVKITFKVKKQWKGYGQNEVTV